MFTLPCRHRAIHEKTRVHTKEEKPRVENPYQYQNYTGSARWNIRKQAAQQSQCGGCARRQCYILGRINSIHRPPVDVPSSCNFLSMMVMLQAL